MSGDGGWAVGANAVPIGQYVPMGCDKCRSPSLGLKYVAEPAEHFEITCRVCGWYSEAKLGEVGAYTEGRGLWRYVPFENTPKKMEEQAHVG